MHFEQALTHLQSYFGYDSFRKGQEESIRYVLEGHNTACIMPTGEGNRFVIRFLRCFWKEQHWLFLR